jgi:peptidyl-prolyl cis-trans isomerase SurA
MKSKLMRNNQYLLALFFSAVSFTLFAQPTPDDGKNQLKLDGVAAVVGDEIVLDSDIERDYVQAKAQGIEVENECEFLENILVDKILLTKAKEDTLIVITNDQVDRQVDATIQRFLTQGSEQQILDFFGYNTMPEFKQELRGIMRDQAYAQQKQELITKDVDATPEEVREFYDKYKNDLPDIPEEVEMSQIVVYPDIFPENEQKVVDQLNQYKKEIEDGSSFATKAILYSQDPGSASNGGLITNVKRGQMVPEFDAVAFNLQEGEISEPFKTEFGYHIVMLEKRRGQEIDIRHILIPLTPTAEEIALTKEKMDSVVMKITTGEMTFKEAALKYSVDKFTKYNGGKMMDQQTMEDRLERSKLPAKTLVAITSLQEGDISDPFEDEFNGRPVIRIVQLIKSVPTHKINYETDYSRLKNMTINNKKQEILMKWVGEQIPDTFIKVDEDYKDCQFRLDWRKEK